MIDEWFMMTQEEVEYDHFPNADCFVATGKPLISKE